jgi:glycine/D-amino acid oxidase-like deaminating enzyme
VVSEEAEFLDDIPDEFASFYSVVPQERIDDLLEVRGAGYRAVLSDLKGCANSGALVQQVLAYLESSQPDRFRYHDGTKAERIVVRDDGARIETVDGSVDAAYAVMCTNGFVDHLIVDADGDDVRLDRQQRVGLVVGFMAAFVEDSPRTPTAMSYIRNAAIGGEIPYVYITRRTYDRPDDIVTLTCMGGPGEGDQETWTADLPYPGALHRAMDREVRPLAQPNRPPGLPYDYLWHGPMGYNEGRTRVVGPHPEHPALIYNLGCNGIGFLPSIYGGQRIARHVSGDVLEPSIFDPRPADD